MRRKTAFQPNPEANKRLQQIESLAKLMDNQFSLPGTNFRFGLDPLIGLIPFAGDIISLGFQGIMLGSMMKFGISRKVIILMGLNIAIDFLLGSIPIIGNIFDFYFKSSEKNLALLKRHYGEGKHQGSGTWILVLVFILLLAILIGVGYLTYLLLAYFADVLRSWL